MRQKKRRMDGEGEEDEDEDLEFEESVRTLTSLLGHAASASSNTHSNVGPLSSHPGYNIEPLETRVAAISAEIADAIAQAQSRMYEDDLDDDEGDDSGAEDGEGDGGGREGGGREREGIGLGPVVSGIRDELPSGVVRSGFEDGDEDDFPIPLRARRPDADVGIGEKRKR